MPVDHYENFPVASVLLPKRLRYPIEIIYAFARSADDIADEGDASPDERLAGLNQYLHELDKIEQGITPDGELFRQLKNVIAQHELPIKPFRDLISAFSQDTHTLRYASHDALLDYCSRSADPVGFLLLCLYRRTNSENIRMSNAICTSLQMINFWQDVAIDWKKNRIYIPQEDMLRFNVTEDDIAAATVTDAWRSLMQFEINRTRELMLSGAALPRAIPGRIGHELRLVVLGGLKILDLIESVDYDVFERRPVLKKRDWLGLCLRSLVYKY